MNLLVTGGAGFIGSHVVDQLITQGHHVRVLDNLSTGSRDNLNPKAVLVRGEVIELAQAACNEMEAVFHLAAIPSVPLSWEESYRTQRSNEVSTLALLEACLDNDVRKIIFSSSSAVYADLHEQSPYSIGKLTSEKYIQLFSARYGLEAVCLRYFNVYGPRQDASNPYSGVISLFIEKMLKGEPPTIFGDGEQTRDFVYVQDVVQANIKALESKIRFGAFDVGSGTSYTINTIVSELNKLLGKNIKPIHREGRREIKTSSSNISDTVKDLGYLPVFPLARGLATMLAGYLT